MMNDLTFTTAWRQLLDGIAAAGSGGPAPIVLSSLPALAQLAEESSLSNGAFIQSPPGRNIPLAVGLRAVLPETPLFLIMNADCVTLGTNHLIHAARRNIHLTLLLLRSELTAEGESPERVSWGLPRWQRDIENVPTPLEWVAELEAGYVGRANLTRPDELVTVLRDAMTTRGFSAVGITTESALPTGALSRDPWPEYFDSYRAWAAPLRREATAETPAPAKPLPERAVPRLEVRIAGLGGQGIKLAGTVLAEAAGLHGGLWATQRGDYGSATRGGPSMVDVVLGSDPITYPVADHPDVLVLLSQAAADRYAQSVRPGGIVIADQAEVKSPPAGAISVPLTALAREHVGKSIAAGVVALGCLAAVSDVVSLETISLSLQELVPAAVVDNNLAACAAGHAATRAAVRGEGLCLES
jgi:2-oxoglutarate ferredoxin oxidoreductase subunit gamma